MAQNFRCASGPMAVHFCGTDIPPEPGISGIPAIQ
jgi:hypothetical protein